jgi:CpeS-like protein
MIDHNEMSTAGLALVDGLLQGGELQAADRESSPATMAAEFFRQSVGNWHSQRRYYTLADGVIEEVVSQLTVTFLDHGSPELIKLAQLHDLKDANQISCGVITTWNSSHVGAAPRPSRGRAIFGISGNVLFRDRGFSTVKPVVAKFVMRDANTMVLKTAYNDSSFEEELKLIGHQYRTRQTIISRAGEEQMIGQYLEQRVDHF